MVYVTRPFIVVSLFFLFLQAPLPDRVAAQVSRSTLPSEITRLLDHAEFSNAFWGIKIVDLDSGELLFERYPRKSFMPASNMKLFTSSAALNLLGPDWRFQTEIYVDGPIEDGVLNGNVIVRGSGDPTIGGRFNDGDLTRTFRDWADSLRAQGIHHIAGTVIGDGTIFDDVPLGAGWSWGYETEWYAAEIDGLVFNDNCVDFVMSGDRIGTPARITWEPYETDYVNVRNASSTIHPDSSLDRSYVRLRGTNEIVIRSRIPEGGVDRRSLTITNPSRYFAHILRDTLVREGIPVSGTARDARSLPIRPDYQDRTMRRIAVHHSPTLREISSVINKPSQNLYAEQLLKSLGVYASEDEPPARGASAADGVQAATDFFVSAGIDTSIFRMVDGSGLSRQNLVTPEMTINLLRTMAHHPDTAVANSFYESLPVGGMDGTLIGRFREGPAFGNVRAKTGFIGYVRALSGYVTSQGGRNIAFSLTCNHYTIPTRRVNEVQDGIVNLLAVLGD